MFLASTSDFQYTGVNWMNPFDGEGILGRETYTTGAKVTIPFYGAFFLCHLSSVSLMSV